MLNRTSSVAKVVECLPGKDMALSSSPSSAPKMLTMIGKYFIAPEGSVKCIDFCYVFSAHCLDEHFLTVPAVPPL
jgi:hypothetical protein